MRTVKGTKYRKWKSPNSGGRYAGRVHLMFYDKAQKDWRFVCGKRGEDWMGPPRGNVTDDEAVVTCMGCTRHAPDVVEKMDVVPSLEEFQ